MSAETITSAAPTPSRFVDICPECGYSLVGSPDEGNCPECGVHYDQRVMILHGAAMGKNSNIANVSSQKLWGALFVPLFLLAGNALFLFDGEKMDTRRLLVVAGCALFIIISLISRWNRSRPGFIVVYLSPWGCLQRNDVLPIEVHRAFFPSLFFLILLSFLGIAMVTENDIETRAKQIALLGAGMALSIYLIVRALKAPARPRRRKTPAQMLEATGHRWRGTEELSCEAASPGHVHLQIYLKNGRQLSELVDADVVCDEPRRSEIEKLVSHWIHTASPQPVNPAISS